MNSITEKSLHYNIIDDLYWKYTNINFVTYCLSGTELAFDLITSSNQWLDKNSFDHICIFTSIKDLPVVTPNFGVFHTQEMYSCIHTIIACDLPSWHASINAPTKNKFLWLYDISPIIQGPKDTIENLNKSGFIIFTRNKKYNQYLRSLGLNTINSTLDSCDIGKLKEIINENIRN